MKILDLFCGAGGAGEGYRRAGFDVTGIDINPMPNNPHTIIQADAIAYAQRYAMEYDAIHASPPCQRYSALASRWNNAHTHPDLIDAIRKILTASGKPYVIENVPGAPLEDPVTLCGSMFALNLIKRHRLFEASFPLPQPDCDHSVYAANVFPSLCSRTSRPARVLGIYGNGGLQHRLQPLWPHAMGIDWMTPRQLAQAIPPDYTEYIGNHLMAYLTQHQQEAPAA